MKSTIEILTKLQENSQKNHDEIFTRLYRYLLRPDIYFIAYQHLYSNKGAGTKGVNDDTADGFSEQYVTAIIEALRTGSYEPKPVRRTYIQKKNGKLRPLGLPVFADKLVQEAIRMILEAIYEPIFSIYSHGFRPGRSCHTALAMIKHEFTGAKWFIEGDIKGCFDNIDHSTLIGVLNRKIKDARFLNLIRMFLKSGYMEDWNFHETYSGCPQGGIISPILANVYLNELDRYITQLKKEFDHGYNPRNFTEEYNAIRHKRDAIMNVIMCFANGIGEIKYPTIVNLFILWGVRIPVAYLLSRLGYGGYAMASVPLSFLAGMILMLFYFRTKHWAKLCALAKNEP